MNNINNKTDNLVKYVPQNFSDSAKAQARENLGLANLFVSPGETIENSSSIFVGGYISSSTKSCYFTIPIAKRLDNVSNVVVNSLRGGIRTANGYLNGSSGSYEWTTASNITIYPAIVKETNCVTVVIATSSSFTNAPNNNTPIAIGCNFSFTFS